VSEQVGTAQSAGDRRGDVGALRRDLVDCARMLFARGLLSQTSGNISVRAGEDRMLITPASMPYHTMQAEDLVLTGLDGAVVSGHFRPSSEVPLHVAVYAARPDLQAIVHTHSPLATTFAVLRQAIPAVHYMVSTLDQSAVRVVPYALFGSDELAANVSTTFVAPARAVLLANHGVVVGGATLAQAAVGAETVELLAGLYHRALAVGTPHILDDAQLSAVSEQIRFRSYARTTS
jgi:L-fuculose-phosphate aldolase